MRLLTKIKLFLKRLIRIILNPLYLIRYIYKEFKLRTGDQKNLENIQNKIYESLSLDRKKGLEKINEIFLNEFGKPYDENYGMSSEHLILFASISLKNWVCKNILEIGTYDGRTALILSRLFPNSNIITIDLPSNLEDFTETYQREQHSQFVSNRHSWLEKSNNIDFKEMNSICLLEEKGEIFDLIWVDGAHGYPVVPIDITNAYRLIKPGGYVLLDDVWAETINYTSAEITKSADQFTNKWYHSKAAYETLVEMKASSYIEDFNLIPKRTGIEHNLSWTKKYVGVLLKSLH